MDRLGGLSWGSEPEVSSNTMTLWELPRDPRKIERVAVIRFEKKSRGKCKYVHGTLGGNSSRLSIS